MWCKHYAAIISVTHENEELQWELFEDGHSQSKFKKKIVSEKNYFITLECEKSIEYIRDGTHLILWYTSKIITVLWWQWYSLCKTGIIGAVAGYCLLRPC